MGTVILLAGLGFGDEGKGTTIDFLTREHNASMVVRYNGGGQAAHNVVTSDGRHHVFAQFGSGTFVPGVRTHLSRHMMVNPISMLNEEAHLREVGISDAFARTTLERTALVTTPYHVAANRLRELIRDALLKDRRAGSGRHGSCGMGIGETMSDSLVSPEDCIRVQDFEDRSTLVRKLERLRERKRHELSVEILDVPVSDAMAREYALLKDDAYSPAYAALCESLAKSVAIVDDTFLTRAVAGSGTILFEGAQGMLLDQDWGFHPYTTWSNITFENAHDLLKDCAPWPVKKVGVLRAHMTRHGAGPMPTFDSTFRSKLTNEHNGTGPWQENFRVGYLDLPLLEYASRAIGHLDYLSVTHLDLFEQFNQICLGYAGPREISMPSGTSNTPGRLQQQEENGKFVAGSRPLYAPVKSVDELLETIEGALYAPVSICSYGPTAEDKRKR